MKIALVVISVLVALPIAGGTLLWLMRDRVIQSLLPVPGGLAERYPMPTTMPAAISTPIDELLAKYLAILEERAPDVFAALQSGLSDAEIDAIEQKHSIKLTADLRALYRWHNGSKPGASKCAFPDHEFIPLDVALRSRDQLAESVSQSSSMQRTAFDAFAGHTKTWVGIIVDPAGDGHFYDPQRTETQGSFFFSFKEDGTYIFYPRFANYLLSVIEGFESGIYGVDEFGVTTMDYEKAHQQTLRFGWIPSPQ